MSLRTFRLLLLVAAMVWCINLPVAGQGLNSDERRIAAYVDDHLEDAIEFLGRVVDVNSGTMNHEGVRQVGRLFAAELDALGFATRWIDMPDDVDRAGHLFAGRTGDQGKRLLLIGHLDTVFERNSLFQHFEREGTIARGPGVEDMKGGDVIMLYALKALHSAGALDGTSIVVALTGDEESAGSPKSTSRRDLIEAARRSDAALGFEGGVGMSTRYATVARRGASGWTLRVTGTRGHSSQIFKDDFGAGAIFEAARILTAFHDDVRGEEYLTFNPGILVGGTLVEFDQANAQGTAFGKTNVIAQTVVVDGGLRFISEDQKERARAKMREIVADNLPGTSAGITFEDSYPAMSPTAGNDELMRELDRVSRDLGYGAMEAVDPGRRGAADVSFVAPLIDALDGLGAVGAGGHTPSEMVDLSTLPVVIKRAAILIYRLTREAPRTE